MERRVSSIVLRIDIRSLGKQSLYGLRAVANSQAMKRNDFVNVFGINIRPIVQEKHHDFEMNSPAGPVKRRAAIFISGLHQLRILFDQSFHTFQIPLLSEFMNLIRERLAAESGQTSHQDQYQ